VKLIYDKKYDRLYEAQYNFTRDCWFLYYEDEECIINARTRSGLLFTRLNQLTLIGDL